MKKYNKLKDKDKFLEENPLIFKKYKPIKKIGYGSFGNIYSAIRLADKSVFAMKTEKISPGNKTLESEAYHLYSLQGGLGIPKLISYGHYKSYNILIETLLDKSLCEIYVKNKHECKMTDICLIGIQILDRLEWIHSKDIIYRDVKPQNFLIGINDPNVIYIVDFGLCKKYRSSKTGKHIMPKLTGKFNGTLKYASLNALKGKESSRRDDLISLGYMLIYIIKKELPWQGTFKNLNKSSYFDLLYYKDTNGCGKLFDNLPKEFSEYIKYCRNLKFEQDPNYSYLRSLFVNILSKMNLDYKILAFSWIKNDKNKKLLGVPRNKSKRKETPQSRLLKSLEKHRQTKSKDNLMENIKKIDFRRFKSDNFDNLISKKKAETNILESNNIIKNHASLINKLNSEEKKISNLDKISKNNIKLIIIENNSNIYVNKINKPLNENATKANYNKPHKNLIHNDNNLKTNKYKRKKIPIQNDKIKTVINNNVINQMNNMNKNYNYRKKRIKNLTDFNLSNIPIYQNTELKKHLSNHNTYRSPLYKYNITKTNISKEKDESYNLIYSRKIEINKINSNSSNQMGYINSINNYKTKKNNNEINHSLNDKLKFYTKKRNLTASFNQINSNNINNYFNNICGKKYDN